MLGGIYDHLFGCAHKNTSRAYPATMDKSKDRIVATFGHYVVCNDCGREFPYNWSKMRIASKSEIKEIRDILVGQFDTHFVEKRHDLSILIRR